MADIAFIAILKDGQYIHICTRSSSVAEYHIDCHCTALSSLLCILSPWWFYVETLATNGYQGKILSVLFLWSINATSFFLFVLLLYSDNLLSYLQNSVWNIFEYLIWCLKNRSEDVKLNVSSTDPKGQVRYDHSASIVCSPYFSHSHSIFYLEPQMLSQIYVIELRKYLYCICLACM